VIVETLTLPLVGLAGVTAYVLGREDDAELVAQEGYEYETTYVLAPDEPASKPDTWLGGWGESFDVDIPGALRAGAFGGAAGIAIPAVVGVLVGLAALKLYKEL
jgi:hypothetical protein